MGKMGNNLKKKKKRKRIRPRRVPTDRDSESGLTQLPQKGEKKWGNPEKKKNEKELGRTDRKFRISRSKSPYP